MLIRYESCAMMPLMSWFDIDLASASRASGGRVGSRHWFGDLVKTWMAVAPIAAPRSGAR